MYIRKTYICGRVIEVIKTKSTRYGRRLARSPNRSETPEAMAKANERHAAASLARILNANFGPGDFHMVLTYRTDARPKTPEEARRILENFKRRLRRLYRSLGTELKYVSVTEYARTSFHHHFVVPAADIQRIQELWSYGNIHVTPLYPSGEYSGLADYLIKETKQSFRSSPISAKRWDGSKNLLHPEPIVEIISANQWRKEPKARKGYYIDKASVKEYTSADGNVSQYYRMIQLQQPVKRRRIYQQGRLQI